MPAVSLAPAAKLLFLDNNGNPLVDGKLYTYEAGTTTPLNTYTDSTGATPNANPVIIDSRGEASVWLAADSYKLVLKDENDVDIWTVDNITTAEGELSLSGGSALIGFIQAGAGAVARTAQAKMRDWVSVLDFGVDPTGNTLNTTEFQNALDAHSAVMIPDGCVVWTDTVTLNEGQVIFGEGAGSIIRQNTTTGNTYGTLYANSGSAGAQLENITIRDLRIEGPNIAAPVFSEFEHLVSLNGVKNVLVVRVSFIGFRGDGLYVGSGVNGGDERHNTGVIVKNCYFDGVNNENRNAISVIDCDGLWVEDNVFERCTKSTMPGAVDVEPDAQVFHVVSNVNITGNKFYDIGGTQGAITVYLPGVVYTTPPRGFNIVENYIEDATTNGVFFDYALTGGIGESTANFAVRISKNTVSQCGRPFSIFNCKDVVLDGNSFQECTLDALLSFSGDQRLIDCVLRDNLFYQIGSAGSAGVSIFECLRLTLDNNTFNDCGAGTPGNSQAIDFNTGVSAYVKLINNYIIAPNGTTLIAIQKEAGHTFTPDTNTFQNNELSGLASYFDAEISDFAEQTYTPVVAGETSAGTGVYDLQFGRWMRVGKQVFFRCKVIVQAGHTGTGQILVSLPTAMNQESNDEQTTVTATATGVSSTGGHVGLMKPDVVIGSEGSVGLWMQQTGTMAVVPIPAGAFTVYVAGFYRAP